MEIRAIKIAEFGVVPRGMKKHHRDCARRAYQSTGELFHREMAALRFTEAHGKAAGYKPRSGEKLPWGSKDFWRSYFGRKVKGGKLPGGRTRPGTRAPLVWSGDTRNAARMATIAANSNRVNNAYNLRVLNFIPWAREEFSRVLESEATELGQHFDGVYFVHWHQAADNDRTVIE